MLTFSLPEDKASFEFRAVLGESEYTIALEWNQREARWYLSLSDTSGDLIVSRVKVVADWPLLRRVNDGRRPVGDLYALDTLGLGEPPAYTGWGERWWLVYQ